MSRVVVSPRLLLMFTYMLLGVAGSILAGCGSASSANEGGQQPPSSPGFSLSLSTSTLTVNSGGTASVNVSINASAGFDAGVTLQLAGLPTGVTFSPSSLQVTPGNALRITFAAGAYLSAVTSPVTITGTSGSLSQTAQLTVTVKQSNLTGAKTRTHYVRTDSDTQYPYILNQTWTVFDSPTNRFFVSDPAGNQIMVLDAATETEVSVIVVPGALGIDEAPDHSILYAGTQIGDVYAIDPVAMQVTHRYLASEIGPNGYRAYAARALANGSLALLGNQTLVDGYGSLAVWNPSTNAFTEYGGSALFCAGGIGAFTLTGDRSLIVAGSVLGGTYGGGTLCTLNPVTGAQTSVTGNRTYLYTAAVTPDGHSILVPDDILNAGGPTGPQSFMGQVDVYDSQTLTRTGNFTVATSGDVGISMIVSPDSKTLYVGNDGDNLYAYDIASGTQIGWLPNLFLNPLSGGLVVGSPGNLNLQAFDSNGMLAGPMEEGVGFLDTTALQAGSPGSVFLNDYMIPGTGPVSGGTQTLFENLSSTASIKAAYLGGNPMTSLSNVFTGTTSAGSPGPADLYAVMDDGGMLIVPEAFSYGPTILEATPNGATADGGGTGVVLGYGFSSGSYSTSLPPGLQITVGGQPATVTAYDGNAYGVSSEPFQLQSVSFTIPPGAAGTSGDVTVTSSSGATTSHDALQYLPASQQFPLAGAALAQGTYDAKRDLYYFTDAMEVKVFSRAQGQWLTPFQVPPAPNGTVHRLWGIALSPDGSKLAVSDASAGMIYRIDPDSPSAVQSFVCNQAYIGGYLENILTADPSGLAISNSGMIYFASFTIIDGYDGVFKLDTNTGQIEDYQTGGGNVPLVRVVITPDDSTVLLNDDGAVLSIDTVTDKISTGAFEYGANTDYELALSSTQTNLYAAGFLFDTNFTTNAYLAINDREELDIAYVYGSKMSADGTLLFQPSTNGIDIFDGRLGVLLKRMSLPFALSQNYDALVSDGKDNVLIAITGQTGTGIAVIDLTAIPAPSPLPYSKKSVRPSSVGWHGTPLAADQTTLHSTQSDLKPRQVARRGIRHVSNPLHEELKRK